MPLHDHNGNVTVLLDKHGDTIETYRYTAFGEEEIFGPDNQSLSHSINPWRFSSKRHDPETGLIYFGHRYYDPSIGRWTTPDPIGTADGPNLYAYLHHNPLTNIDLYGMFEFDCGFSAFDRLTESIHSIAINHTNQEGWRGVPFKMESSFQAGESFSLVNEIKGFMANSRSILTGIDHGALDFTMGTLHTFQTGAAYIGSSFANLNSFDRYQMQKSLQHSQLEQSSFVDNFYGKMLNIQTDTLHQTYRERSIEALETCSLLSGGYEIGRKAIFGLKSFRNLSKTIGNIFKNNSEILNLNKSQKINDCIVGIENFLCGKGKLIHNQSGDLVLMRENKKIRFDIFNTHGDKPHFHIEIQTKNGRWVDAGTKHRYYFLEE